MVSRWMHLEPGEGPISWYEARWREGVSIVWLLDRLFLEAVSQLLTPINIVLSMVVIFGILGVQSFVAGLRGK